MLFRSHHIKNRTRSIWIPLSEFIASENTPDLAIRNYASSEIPAWAFDPATKEAVSATFVGPVDLLRIDTTGLKIYWTVPSSPGATQVAWAGDISGEYDDGDEVALPNAPTAVNTTPPTAEIIKVTTLSLTAAITVRNNTGTHLYGVRVKRRATDAGDSTLIDAHLLAVRIDYLADM